MWYYFIEETLYMPPPHDHGDIERQVGAIPHFEELPEAIREKIALAVLRELEKNNPNLYEVIKGNVDAINAQMQNELPRDANQRLVATDDQLRGIIAKAAIAGAAQVLHSVGKSLAEIHALESEYNLDSKDD